MLLCDEIALRLNSRMPLTDVRCFVSLSLLPSSLLSSGQFGENFMRGNPLVVYPFLHWVLEGFEKNKTRGYLARYLRPFSIPEEHFADNQIVNMYQQYQTRQSEFKELHIQVEEARQTASNPSHLQSEVTQLENEKEQLHNKLEKLRARISNDPEYASVNFDEMLHVTNLLRQEQEQEAKLYQDLQEQKMKLARADQIRNATAKKFQEMNHSDMARMDPMKLIAKMREEVAQRRDYLEGKLEVAIADRERQLKHLTKIASNNQEYTLEDVHDLQREKHDLEADVDHLLQARENSAGANDSKITFVRDRLANVDKKREKLLEQVAELEDEKSEAERDLQKAQAEFKQLIGQTEDATLPNGAPRPKTEAQMKEYMNELNRKTQKYKTLKGELESERSEITVLMRTEEILRSRDQNIAEFNAEQEKRLGVVGFSSAQDTLEAVSAAKQALDANKGETLEEISSIVERINATLKKKKEKLAPQIKDLRAVRADFEAIESVYRTKKSQYENISLGFESERLKLEQDVQQHQQGITEEESQYHFLHCFAALTAARQSQVSREARGDAAFRELYEKSILDQEAVTKQLRTEKKHITEHHDDHVAQRSMFHSLRGILAKKLEITQNPNGNPNGAGAGPQSPYGASFAPNDSYRSPHHQPSYSTGSNSYLDQLAEESDRLVLEQ